MWREWMRQKQNVVVDRPTPWLVCADVDGASPPLLSLRRMVLAALALVRLVTTMPVTTTPFPPLSTNPTLCSCHYCPLRHPKQRHHPNRHPRHRHRPKNPPPPTTAPQPRRHYRSICDVVCTSIDARGRNGRVGSMRCRWSRRNRQHFFLEERRGRRGGLALRRRFLPLWGLGDWWWWLWWKWKPLLFIFGTRDFQGRDKMRANVATTCAAEWESELEARGEFDHG
mmetsp:Transcript_30842/g.65239  ORF Transcript_30842/g.65239 Transcript_30842/m.65239 type:complete len:226 (-) Transcript_30842:33-710(-)